ncbi:hypothetical protein H8356DRAFT_1658397 [Neocallimastix lanati (nom. inval.)]|nr:hypothetical protein H8356DRAFT_1658397 [Neocallimastix sp. JGI-2020a]
MLSLKYPQFNLGFSWIIRLRCGYKYNTTIAIRMGEFQKIVPRLAPVVAKVINLFSIGFLNAMLLQLLDGIL